MSVDSVYFLADIDRTQRLWHQPLNITLRVAKEWTPPGERVLGLLHRKGVESAVIPALMRFAEGNDIGTSLAELSATVAEALEEVAVKTRGGLFGDRRSNPGSLESVLQRAADLASLYASVIEFNRTGPITVLGNTRATDMGFSEFLRRYMDEEEASKYNSSDRENLLGPAIPPEYNALPLEIIEKLELLAELPYQVDARVWLSRWERLEKIPGFWDALAEEGTRFIDMRHIRDIGNLCQFAVRNNLAMFKVIT